MSFQPEVPVFHLLPSPSSSAQSSPILRSLYPVHNQTIQEFKMDHDQQQQQQQLLQQQQQHAAASAVFQSSPVVLAESNSSSSNKAFLPSKPDVFDDKQNPKLWLLGFKNYCLAAGVPADKVVRFAVSQGRSASFLLWWNSVESTVDILKWDVFEAAFLKQFSPMAAATTARLRLYELKQGEKTVEQYRSEFNQLLHNITDMNVADQIQLFIKGLKPYLQRYLFQQIGANYSGRTLIEVMQLANHTDQINRSFPSSAAVPNQQRNSRSNYNNNNSSFFHQARPANQFAPGNNSNVSSSSTAAPMDLSVLQQALNQLQQQIHAFSAPAQPQHVAAAAATPSCCFQWELL